MLETKVIEEKLLKRLERLSNLSKTTILQDDASKEWINKGISLIGIPKSMLETCVNILEYMGDLKVIWLHLQECTGCSESLLRTDAPSFERMIFDIFKIEYHDLIMSASGNAAIKTLEEAARSPYVLLVEGSVPMGFAKYYITLGNRSGYEEVSHLIQHAQAVFAVGTCSSFGGIQTAYPNPTNGHALHELFNKEIIHIPGCPPSDKNIVTTLLYYYLFCESPELDSLRRPIWAYGKSVHDLCERKSFFMSGDFVESFDDPNMQNGYCLYKVGCKGPYTYNNCPKIKFNAKTSWPVQSGHGCIGCSEPNFWDNFGNIERPLSNKSFFKINPKFILQPKYHLTLLADYPKIQNNNDLLSFAKENKIQKSFFFECSPDKSLILLQNGESCHNLSAFHFEINPKLLINAYAQKNKQAKKLYENYKKAFPKRFKSLQMLPDTSTISNNIHDILVSFLLILGEDALLTPNLLQSLNAVYKSPQSSSSAIYPQDLMQSFFTFAREFKFPYKSALDCKIKKDGDKINLEVSKMLGLSLAYRIGGLDVYGICYSLLCEIMSAFADFFITNEEKETTVILQGQVFQEDSVQKQFLQKHDILVL